MNKSKAQFGLHYTLFACLYLIFSNLPFSLMFSHALSSQLLHPLSFTALSFFLPLLSIFIFRKYAITQKYSPSAYKPASLISLVIYLCSVAITLLFARPHFLAAVFCFPLYSALYSFSIISSIDLYNNSDDDELLALKLGRLKDARLTIISLLLLKTGGLFALLQNGVLEKGFSTLLTISALGVDLLFFTILRQNSFKLMITIRRLQQSTQARNIAASIITSVVFIGLFALLFSRAVTVKPLKIKEPKQRVSRSYEIPEQALPYIYRTMDRAQSTSLIGQKKRVKIKYNLRSLFDALTAHIIAWLLYLVFYLSEPFFSHLNRRREKELSFFSMVRNLIDSIADTLLKIVIYCKYLFNKKEKQKLKFSDTPQVYTQAKMRKQTLQKRLEIRSLFRLYNKLVRWAEKSYGIQTVKSRSVSEFFILLSTQAEENSTLFMRTSYLFNKAFFGDATLERKEYDDIAICTKAIIKTSRS